MYDRICRSIRTKHYKMTQVALVTDMGEVGYGNLPIAPVGLGLVKNQKGLCGSCNPGIIRFSVSPYRNCLCHRIDTTYVSV